jgi:acetyl-CoA synthetase
MLGRIYKVILKTSSVSGQFPGRVGCRVNYNTAESKTMFKPPGGVIKQSHVKDQSEYQRLYEQSLKPEFWGSIAANNFTWKTPFPKNNILQYNFSKKKGRVFVEWFKGGKTNVCFNALDRHLEKKKDQVRHVLLLIH